MALSLHDALAHVLAAAAPLDAEPVALVDAAERVIAQDHVAAVNLPPFDNSAMDGFALRAADTAAATRSSPVALTLVGESRAGSPSPTPLRPECAIRISTGAAMPPGADAVLRVEDATVDGDTLLVSAQLEPGHDVRPLGDDISAGETVIEAGSRLGVGELTMLAANGATSAWVVRRPRVAIMPTGDELKTPGEPLGPGEIYDSSSTMIGELVRASGGLALGSRPAGDDRDETVERIRAALAESDVLVISGGVSMGRHDHVKPALESAGVREVFWRVQLRPGHPVWFGLSGDGRPVFGLPGNPVSGYITFRLLVEPVLARMSGRRTAPLDVPATYRGPTQTLAPGVVTALRVSLTSAPSGLRATLTAANQRSHSIASLVGLDGIALVGPDVPALTDGDRIQVRLTT